VTTKVSNLPCLCSETSSLRQLVSGDVVGYHPEERCQCHGTTTTGVEGMAPQIGACWARPAPGPVSQELAAS
jgi:hypothetical protein